MVWGDGYFKGREEDQQQLETSEQLQQQRGGREENQLLRRKILGGLQALIGTSSTDQEDASTSSGLDNVTDTEWFYLESMLCSFTPGVGYGFPTRACPWCSVLSTALIFTVQNCNKGLQVSSVNCILAR